MRSAARSSVHIVDRQNLLAGTDPLSSGGYGAMQDGASAADSTAAAAPNDIPAAEQKSREADSPVGFAEAVVSNGIDAEQKSRDSLSIDSTKKVTKGLEKIWDANAALDGFVELPEEHRQGVMELIKRGEYSRLIFAGRNILHPQQQMLPGDKYPYQIVIKSKDPIYIKNREKISKSALPPPDSFAQILQYNILAALPNILTLMLYIVTTEGYPWYVRYSTTISNELQNQFFMYAVIKSLIKASWPERIKNALFGVIFSLPYGVATYISAEKNHIVMDIVGAKLNPLGQGFVETIGAFALNLYAYDPLKRVIKNIYGSIRSLFCKEDPYLQLLKQSREVMLANFERYIEGLDDQDICKLYVNRQLSLPKQLDMLFQKLNFSNLAKEKNSRKYEFAVKVLILAGVIFTVWSSIGYGCYFGKFMEILFHRLSMGLDQLFGHIALTPIYSMGISAGQLLGAVPALPWIFPKLFNSSSYRSLMLSTVLAFPASALISLQSYGTSLELVKGCPGFFGSSEMSFFVASWFTVLFNTIFTSKPVAATLDFIKRVYQVRFDKEAFIRQGKLDQLQGRKEQVADASDENFAKWILKLDPKTRTALLGKDLARELVEAIGTKKAQVASEKAARKAGVAAISRYGAIAARTISPSSEASEASSAAAAAAPYAALEEGGAANANGHANGHASQRSSDNDNGSFGRGSICLVM